MSTYHHFTAAYPTSMVSQTELKSSQATVSTPRTAIVTSLSSSTFPSLISTYSTTGKMARIYYLETIVEWSVHSITNIVMLQGRQDGVQFVISQTVDQITYNNLLLVLNKVSTLGFFQSMC